MNNTLWCISILNNNHLLRANGKHVGWIFEIYVKDKKRKWRDKGDVEVHTCLSTRGYSFLKHCTPSPSTGHLNSNSAVRTHTVGVSVHFSPYLTLPASLTLLSAGYLIIRQFLSVATYCSRALGPLDNCVLLKSPKVCACVRVWFYIWLQKGHWIIQ